MSVVGNAQQLHTESNAASPDNESDAVTGWYSPGNTLITSETTNPYHGSYVMKIEAGSTSDNDRNARYQFSAVVGEIYEISIWARSGAQTVDPAFASWSGVSGFTNPTPISTSGTWTEYNFTLTATASTVTLRAYTGSASQGATGDVIYLDRVSIVPQDNQDPTAPNNLGTGTITDTTVNLNWSAASDNVAVTGYNVYRDGVLEESLSDVLVYQVIGLSPSTEYSFTVTAVDAAGNESALSNSVSVSTNSGSGSVWTESGYTASYTGEVAIGTGSVPNGYKLAVEGNIRTREIRVDQDTWPDYVFSKEYELLSLEEIKEHIEEKGHLPNIPSAMEVKANGVQLGQMNRLLLEKIEELTLYILEQQEKQLRMEKQITELAVKLKR